MKVSAKIKNLINQESSNGHHGESVEPFYIDRRAERELSKNSTEVMEKLNLLCHTWESVTKKKIRSQEEFDEILRNPATYWRSEKFQENVEQKRERTLSFIDEGYEESEIQKMLKLPSDFHLVLEAIKQVNKLTINWKNFEFVNNGFQLSQYYFERANNKVFYHAITPLQQKRLRKAKALLAAIQDLEEVMIEEAREAGISEDKINKAKENCAYLGPLPYALRHEHSSYVEGKGVEINEKWVVSGLKQWADVIGLPRLALKDLRPIKPYTPIVYLKFFRTDLDGARRLYIIPKDIKERAYFGMYREAAITFIPGEFILDPVTNKLVPVPNE